jgi:hypothetical protein
MCCRSVGCGFPDNSTQSRTAPWDRTIVTALSLCPLLRAGDSEGGHVTSAVADLVAGLSGSASSRSVMSASATRDVLRWFQVTSFDAFLPLPFHLVFLSFSRWLTQRLPRSERGEENAERRAFLPNPGFRSFLQQSVWKNPRTCQPNSPQARIGYSSEKAKSYSRSPEAVIRVYDETGNVIETHEHKGDFKEP